MNKEQRVKKNWLQAYKAFLFDKNENLVLKIAPMVLVLGYPEVIVSNLLPVIGELVDIGAFTVTLLVVYQTIKAVSRHR